MSTTRFVLCTIAIMVGGFIVGSVIIIAIGEVLL